MKTKLLVAFAMLVSLASCVKTRYNYVDDNLKDWFVAPENCSFVISDDDTITQSFIISDTTSEFLLGESYFMGFQTSSSMNESIYQNGFTSFSASSIFGLCIDAYSDVQVFCLLFYQTYFILHYIDNEFVLPESNEPECSFEYLETYEVDGKTYDGVLHIISNEEKTDMYEAKEVYYAKHYGPIKYELGDSYWLTRRAD